MPLDDLLEALSDEVETEAAERLRAARVEAEQIVEDARQQAEARRGAHREAVAREGAETRREALAQARQAARERVLRARAAWLDRVFEATRAEAGSPEGIERWAEGLAAQLREARTYIAGEAAVARCRPELSDVVLRAARGELLVEVDPEGPDGVEVHDPAARVRVDLSAERQLRAAWTELATHLVRQLEEAG